MSSLGEKLLNARLTKGYSQIDLSKKSGITQNLISEYENDKTIPNAKSLFYIAKSLEISIDELFDLKTNVVNIKNTKVLRRMKIIENLPTKEQELVLMALDLILKGTASK